jgi:hypothetical protein
VAAYRDALLKIGEPGADGAIPALRSGFATAPSSLRAAMAAMEDPRPALWTMPHEENVGEDWTQNCQGVARGGGHWYFSSNGSFFGSELDGTPRAIFKLKGGDVVATMPVTDDDANHLGALNFHEGQLFAALESSPHSPHGSAVMSVHKDLTFSQFLPLLAEDGRAPPQGNSMPWCAIHPWNGLLYSSRFDDVHVVHAYGPADDGCRHVPSEDIALHASPALDRVQGGCFSSNGHLYLASDVLVDSDHKAIHVFSALNGAYRGAIKVLALEGNQELEGICFAPMKIGGHAVQLHVVLLEIFALEKDDIFFKHYAAPDPARV